MGIFLSSPVILLSSRGANGAYDNLGATPLCKDLGSRGSLYVRSNTLDEDMALPNINTKGKYELWHSFPLSPPLEWCNDRTTPPLSYYVVFLNALLMLKKKNSARHTNKPAIGASRRQPKGWKTNRWENKCGGGSSSSSSRSVIPENMADPRTGLPDRPRISEAFPTHGAPAKPPETWEKTKARAQTAIYRLRPSLYSNLMRKKAPLSRCSVCVCVPVCVFPPQLARTHDISLAQPRYLGLGQFIAVSGGGGGAAA